MSRFWRMLDSNRCLGSDEPNVFLDDFGVWIIGSRRSMLALGWRWK